MHAVPEALIFHWWLVVHNLPSCGLPVWLFYNLSFCSFLTDPQGRSVMYEKKTRLAKSGDWKGWRNADPNPKWLPLASRGQNPCETAWRRIVAANWRTRENVFKKLKANQSYVEGSKGVESVVALEKWKDAVFKGSFNVSLGPSSSIS